MRLLLLAATLLAAPAFAQDAPADTLTILPGDAALTTDWMEAGSTSYVMRLTAPMQQNVGTADETITMEGGVVTRVMTLSIRSPQGSMTQTDSLRADAGSLTPMTHHSSGGQMEASLEFMAEGVVGMLTPGQGEASTVMLMTDAPVFDSAWAGEIAQSLPHAEGAVFKVPAFSSQSPEETFNLVYTVTGQETIGEGDDARTAWIVVTDMGPVSMTHVVDAATRAMIETRFSPQPGVSLVIEPTE